MFKKTNFLKVLAVFCISHFLNAFSFAAEDLVIEDWLILCGNNGDKHCMMTQTIVNPENKKDLLGVALGFFPGKNKPSLAMNLPPQLDPQRDVVLVFGNSEKGRQFSVDQCDDMKCSTVRVLNESILNQMKRANSAYILFYLKDGTDVKVNFSMNGFNDAYRYVLKSQQ